MKNGYYPYPKRDPKKNFFMVPNEVFSIGLSCKEISLYTYLLRCENRETYQCYPSYKTIGKSIGMSEKDVYKRQVPHWPLRWKTWMIMTPFLSVIPTGGAMCLWQCSPFWRAMTGQARP